MKKLIYGGAFLFLLSTNLTSCKKDQIKDAVNNDNPAYVYLDKNGMQIDYSKIQESNDNTVLIASNTTGKVVVHYFENEDEAYLFLSSQTNYKDALAKLDFVREVRALAEKTGDIHKENYDDFSEEMKALLASYKAPVQTKGTGILWDNLNASGSTCPVLAVPQPTLFSFNNKGESATGVGLANWLWDKKWFKGRSVYLLLGTASVIPFDGIDFRNMAESAL